MDTPKAFDLKDMMSEEAIKRVMDMPVQAVNLAIETSKKIQDASVDYYRQVERIQREHWQTMSRMMSTVLPGESNLWEAQTKMVESGFDFVDRMMAAGKKA